MKSASEIKKIVKGWDMKSYDSCMVLSDYLLDMNEKEWANMVRWTSHLLFFGNDEEGTNDNISWWQRTMKLDLATWFNFLDKTTLKIDSRFYNAWKEDAIKRGLEVIQ